MGLGMTTDLGPIKMSVIGALDEIIKGTPKNATPDPELVRKSTESLISVLKDIEQGFTPQQVEERMKNQSAQQQAPELAVAPPQPAVAAFKLT